MLKIAIIRGRYLNQYEMQSYEPLASRFKIMAFSSKKPLEEKFKFPVKKLFSPLDLPDFPYKLPILNRLCFGDSMYLFGLEKALGGFDLAHSRETYFHFTQQALNAKKARIIKKVLVTVSETIPFNHEGIWRRKTFKKRSLKEADHFHTLTEKAKRCLIKEGCDPKKITVIPYGIDLNKFKVSSSAKATADKKNSKLIKLLFVGRLVKEKGIYDVLRAFVQLIKEKTNCQLTIIGNGEEKESIKNLINQIGFNQFIKIKKVSYAKMSEEYQKADIFVLASKPTKYWEEYFGMSLIEAMACGLPVVSTTSGAIPEVVGKAGLLVTPGKANELFFAFRKLIENIALRKKLSLKARQRAENYFDSRKVALKIGKLYKKILNK